MRYSPAILVGLFSLTGSLMAGPVLFSVSVIQGPSGTTGPFANSINNLGQIVGTATGPGSSTVLFLDSGGSSVAVPYTLSSGNTPEREFINNAGQIAGYAGGGVSEAFFGSASGVSTVPGSAGALVYGLNNLGTFVGDIVGTSGMIGTATGITLLPYPDSEAISNLGQVTVFSSPQAFLLTGGVATPLAVFNGDPSSLNDSGQAAGAIGFLNEGTPMEVAGAFVATTTGATLIVPLGDLPGSAFINNEGAVVGRAVGVGDGAYIWDPVNGLQALSALVPTGWAITSANAINDGGQVLATATFDGGSQESVLLTPLATPEPSTISMMLATIALFSTIHFARRRRRS